jgi:hypothetical protein
VLALQLFDGTSWRSQDYPKMQILTLYQVACQYPRSELHEADEERSSYIIRSIVASPSDRQIENQFIELERFAFLTLFQSSDVGLRRLKGSWLS